MKKFEFLMKSQKWIRIDDNKSLIKQLKEKQWKIKFSYHETFFSFKLIGGLEKDYFCKKYYQPVYELLPSNFDVTLFIVSTKSFSFLSSAYPRA